MGDGLGWRWLSSIVDRDFGLRVVGLCFFGDCDRIDELFRYLRNVTFCTTWTTWVYRTYCYKTMIFDTGSWVNTHGWLLFNFPINFIEKLGFKPCLWIDGFTYREYAINCGWIFASGNVRNVQLTMTERATQVKIFCRQCRPKFVCRLKGGTTRESSGMAVAKI